MCLRAPNNGSLCSYRFPSPILLHPQHSLSFLSLSRKQIPNDPVISEAVLKYERLVDTAASRIEKKIPIVLDWDSVIGAHQYCSLSSEDDKKTLLDDFLSYHLRRIYEGHEGYTYIPTLGCICIDINHNPPPDYVSCARRTLCGSRRS